MNLRTSLTAFLCGFGLSATSALAQNRPSLSVEGGTSSQYIWRGLVVTDGPVFQTSTTAGYRGFHVNLFSSMDLNGVNRRRGRFSELDYDFGYDRSFEKATLSGGVARYTYPNTVFASTTEWYAGAGLNVFLRPSARVYTDVGSIHGSYATFDVAHAFALPRPRRDLTWSAELTAGFGVGSRGFNQGYYGVGGRRGLVDFHPAIALPLGLGSRFRLTPRVGYASVVDGTLRQSSTAKAHNFFCSVGLSLGM